MNGHVPFTNANNGRNFTAAHRARDTSGRERDDTTPSPPKVRFASDTCAPSGDHSRKLWLPPKLCTASDNKRKSIELHQFTDQHTSAEKDASSQDRSSVPSAERQVIGRERHTVLIMWPLPSWHGRCWFFYTVTFCRCLAGILHFFYVIVFSSLPTQFIKLLAFHMIFYIVSVHYSIILCAKAVSVNLDIYFRFHHFSIFRSDRI